MTLNELFIGALTLQPFFVNDQTGDGWYAGCDQDGNEIWNHWNGALEVLKKIVGRRLSDAELCILSLSLDYGPTPGIDGLRRARWSGVLFPRRNMTGGALSPLEAVRRLAWSERDEKLEKEIKSIQNPPVQAKGAKRSKFSAEQRA